MVAFLPKHFPGVLDQASLSCLAAQERLWLASPLHVRSRSHVSFFVPPRKPCSPYLPVMVNRLTCMSSTECLSCSGSNSLCNGPTLRTAKLQSLQQTRKKRYAADTTGQYNLRSVTDHHVLLFLSTVSYCRRSLPAKVALSCRRTRWWRIPTTGHTSLRR